MEICIEAMRRCPHFQKSKPEVNSRDVIKWTSEAQVRRSHWLERIFEPNLPQSTNTTLSARQNSQINITWKSIVNNSGLDKGICSKFDEKMHHDHAEMTHDQKSKPEVNLRDVIRRITRALNLYKSLF